MSKSTPGVASALKTSLKKYTFYVKDIAWSIAAVFLMNAVLQLALYPILRKALGEAEYGNILYLLGIVNIIAIPIGSGMSMARIKASTEHSDNGSDYNKILMGTFAIMLPLSAIILYVSNIDFNISYVFLYWALICGTINSHYAAVEYRLNTNYKGYFLYHLVISLGYLFGIVLFHYTNIWILMLLPGELAGGILSLYQTREKRKTAPTGVTEFRELLSPILVLICSQFLVSLVFNADRLILKAIVSSTAVTIYYVSSLVGKTVAMVTEPLNNVLIGHLAKKKGTIESSFLLKIICLIFVSSLLITGLCILGSHIFVFLFYPEEYEVAKQFFGTASFAMVMYCVTGVVNTILLRYMKGRCQLYINVFYIITFLIIVLPATFYGGMWSFAISLCIVNILRFLFASIIGIWGLKKKDRDI